MNSERLLKRLVKLKWRARKCNASKEVINAIQKKISIETARILEKSLPSDIPKKEKKKGSILKIISS